MDNGGVVGIVILLVQIAIFVAIIAGMWKVYTKAGEPGWACIVPIYSFVVLLKIVDKPIWWILLMFIPLVNIIIAIIVCIELAKRFGKGTGYGIGIALLGFIFIPMLGFSDAQYQGSTAE